MQPSPALTADPSAADEIERYAYNGLVGAMKPSGDGFSYVNLLNAVKTNPEGWGAVLNNVHVTCCNLNGPMGLAYLPYIAVMNSRTGPVLNLYNACTAAASTPACRPVRLDLATDYPKSGSIVVAVTPLVPEKFRVRLRIPAWSARTTLKAGGKTVKAVPGTYAAIYRKWAVGDRIELTLDMRCRLLESPRGSNRAADNHQALVRGPVVLARDEHIDADYDKPAVIAATNGYVDVTPVPPTLPPPIIAADPRRLHPNGGLRLGGQLDRQTCLHLAAPGKRFAMRPCRLQKLDARAGCRSNHLERGPAVPHIGRPAGRRRSSVLPFRSPLSTSLPVEVGTSVARRPPHRSRRAVFPHRALQINSLSHSPSGLPPASESPSAAGRNSIPSAPCDAGCAGANPVGHPNSDGLNFAGYCSVPTALAHRLGYWRLGMGYPPPRDPP